MATMHVLERPADVRCSVCGERFPDDYRVCPRDGTPMGRAPAHEDPLIGTVIGGSYRVLGVLARGGMGRLYEAEHTRLARRLVAKVIHDLYAKHPDAVARFEREARAAARIESEHVVRVIDVIRTTDDRPCIVAERLEGEDLEARLVRHGRLSVADAVHIARQLARGLSAAHAQGILHRDLKPSNVFLHTTSDGREVAKLVDFGVAKLADGPDITRSGAVVGTPAYMAPEQARGASRVDQRADVYGLGAVLYRMLTGHSPHEAEDATASLARLLAEEPIPVTDFVPDLPSSVVDLVGRALARDPALRPPSADALEGELARIYPSDLELTRRAPLEEPRTGSEDTLVLPRGAVGDAREAGHQKKSGRRKAIGASLFAALLVAITPLAFARSHAELARIGAVVLFASAVGLAWRLIRARWSDGLALLRLARQLVAGATGAIVTFGATWLGVAAFGDLDAFGPWLWVPASLSALAAQALGPRVRFVR
jgi:serine/threonine protein kinase